MYVAGDLTAVMPALAGIHDFDARWPKEVVDTREGGHDGSIRHGAAGGLALVKLNKIYTRTGDDGTTGLAAGPRRAKHDLRVESYGAVDEANAAIGMARLHAVGSDLDDTLARIQNEMFDLGADLATPDDGVDLGYEPLRIVQSQVDRLETDIDAVNARLEPLKSFVLPAGTPLAANLHMARTIARRAERLMTALAARETVSQAALAYVNRLSDYLFVAARVANLAEGDVLWAPGKTR